MSNFTSYDTLDRIIDSDYHVSHESSDETFVYDVLGNRITHNDGTATVYAANIVNEYTAIGGKNREVSPVFPNKDCAVEKTTGNWPFDQ